MWRTPDSGDNNDDSSSLTINSWDSMEDDDDLDQGEEEEEEEEDDDGEEEDDISDVNIPEGLDREADKKYKPYKHRQIVSPLTNKEARIHLLNGAFGLGIIALPTAFFKFGVVYASIGMILIGAVSTHCLHVLIKSTYRMYCRHRVPHLSYSECMGYAMQRSCKLRPICSPLIAGFIACLVFVTQLSISSTYVKYITSTLKEVLAGTCEVCDNEVLIQAVLFIPLLLLNVMPTIKDLVYLSVIGILASLCAIVITTVDHMSHLSDCQVAYWINLEDYPYFVGVALFATYTLGVVLLLECHMKKPRALIGTKGILNQMMVIVVLTYVMFGFLGAIMFGNGRVKRMVTDPEPLHVKLPDLIFRKDAKVFLTVVCFFSHPLVCFEMFEIVWRSHLKKYVQHTLHLRQTIVESILRAAIVLITVFAAYVKTQDIFLLISVCGMLCMSIVGMVLPCLLHMLSSNKYQPCIFFKDILLISFGLFTFFGGVYKLTTL